MVCASGWNHVPHVPHIGGSLRRYCMSTVLAQSWPCTLMKLGDGVCLQPSDAAMHTWQMFQPVHCMAGVEPLHRNASTC
jgi:hypothetical protein